jgi:pimeloyl-ACP methyl ester carboxylesterase
VVAIVAVEPSGPPVHEIVPASPGFTKEAEVRSEWYSEGRLTKPYGLAALPLVYEPPVGAADELRFVKEPAAQAPELVQGWTQATPARKLANLSKVPVLVVTGEASYHAAYDHLTVAYLRQAGVETTFIRLAEQGIRGNGHMMMLELNNQDIAAVIERWIRDRVSSSAGNPS